MLPNGAVVDDRTHSKLGDTALAEVLACLWPGDCQSCGKSLGSNRPALVVDDLQALARASLHHQACRAPEWNDGLIIRGSGFGVALLANRNAVPSIPGRKQDYPRSRGSREPRP